MIDLGRALDWAWQQTAAILFRPLDAGKWFCIGCAAFMTMMAAGEVSFSNPVPWQQNSTHEKIAFNNAPLATILNTYTQKVSQLQHPVWNWLLGAYVVVGVGLFVFWVVMNWLGSRGEFIFLDNLVRNRGVLAEPWHRYAREGNIWFPLNLVLTAFSYVVMICAAVVFVFANWGWISANRDPNAVEIGGMVMFGIGFICVLLVVAVVAFWIRRLVLPLFFLRGSLRGAFAASWRLTVTQPGNVLLLYLSSILLSFIMGLIGMVIVLGACCFLCWFACIPMFGGVLLAFVVCQLILPLTVFTRCFQLNCLTEMGPEYDVWSAGRAPDFSPPPPRG